VVCIVIFVSATVMFFCGALLVVLRVRHHPAAWKTRGRALQQAHLEPEATLPRRPTFFRTAVLPVLVGFMIGGVIVLSAYLYVAYQSRPILLLGLGVVLLVAAGLRRTRPILVADDADEERPNP
jgi:hypothetical protein